MVVLVDINNKKGYYKCMSNLIDKGYITCKGLKKKVALSGCSASSIEVKLGKSDGWLRQILRDAYLPTADGLAKLSMYFRCKPEELIEFNGFEIKEMYTGYEFNYPENPEGVVTYRPLMELFYDIYTERGDDWKKKLNTFFDGIEPVFNEFITEEQKKAFAENAERNRANATSGRSSNKPGLSVVNRSRIRTDKDMKIIHIYDICKALRCPIGRVMGYK